MAQDDVRDAACHMFTRLPTHSLLRYLCRLLDILSHQQAEIQQDARRAIASLPSGTNFPATHFLCIAALLADGSAEIRKAAFAAFQQLQPRELDTHAAVLILGLADRDASVNATAVVVVRKMAPDTLLRLLKMDLNFVAKGHS